MDSQRHGFISERVGEKDRWDATAGFPCTRYAGVLETGDTIPWNWHKEIEILLLDSGSLTLQIPTRTYCLKAGDCAVINSNILHYAVAESQCELHSLVFDVLLITGNGESAFANNYITPLISGLCFSVCILGGKENKDPVIDVRGAIDALVMGGFGFEFVVREKLSYVCLYLYQRLRQITLSEDKMLCRDNKRLLKVLLYIHNNYSKPLTLGKIADIAGMGERECLRFFQRTIHVSPIQYLLRYRIMRGAALILSDPSAHISDISNICGFDNPSYFTVMFRRFYKCTPRNYRNGGICSIFH